jgi:hypothetical protein
MSKTRIYFNIFITLLLVLLGIYFLSLSKNNLMLFEIPLRLVLGVFLIIVNAVLLLKWVNVLRNN